MAEEHTADQSIREILHEDKLHLLTPAAKKLHSSDLLSLEQAFKGFQPTRLVACCCCCCCRSKQQA
jgi:hypothetical protein